MLRMTNIIKKYGPTLVLDEVQFAVEAGEVMALMGENGAGKSTLVKILAGLEIPQAGTIEIDGHTKHIRSPRDSHAAGIGYVAQELSIVPSLPVYENVFLGDNTLGILRTPRVLAKKAKPFLESVGLGNIDPLTYTESLSVAERQLVEIARLLSREARIAILDEPTAALSDAEIARVKSAVRTLAGRGCAVIYVTHRMPEVFDLTDRVTVLRNGNSFPALETKNLTVDTLIEEMLGRRLDNMFPARSDGLQEIKLQLSGVRGAGLRAPVSLNVRRGEILGLAGQVGSGASSVLRLIAGTIPLAEGHMLLDGAAFRPKNISNSKQAGIAYCSDDRKHDGIFAGRSVPENLSAPALSIISRAGFLSFGKERRLAEYISSRFGIDASYFSRLAGNLSGGNQQKVALGKWIGINPNLLLVEEPTRGVDVGARAEIYRHLRELANAGLCIIFASSDTQEVLGLADRVGTFFHGELVRTMDAADATVQQISKDVTHATEAMA